jgi:hypothetical protein
VLLAEVGRLARARCAAVVLTAALPVLPAYVVSGGVMYVCMASSHRDMTDATTGESIAHRQCELDDRGALASTDSAADTRRDVLRGTAASPGTKSPLSSSEFPALSLMLFAGVCVAFALFLIGSFLAQAALLPVVAGCSRPSEAWAIVAGRFGALLQTILLATLLVMVGLALFAVPGLALALGFSLAAPVVVAEYVRGPEALQRSWNLMRVVWPAQFCIVVIGAAAVLAMRFVLGMYWPLHGLGGRIVLNALVATLVLPFPIAASAILYLVARRVVEGVDSERLCQNVRQVLRRSEQRA